MTDKFIHLHTHSEYSNIRLLDCINKIKNMIKHTVSLGQKSFALTDHESLSGHVQYIKTVKKLKEGGEIPQDFKAILGNEIYLVDEEEMENEVNEYISNFYHFLLIAKDAIGHRQLRELSSRSWGRMFSYKGMDRVPTFYTDIEGIIRGDKGHLIASSACLGGYIPKNFARMVECETDEDKRFYKQNIHEFIKWSIDIFGRDNFYLELQPSDMDEQIAFNKFALTLADAYKLKCIITTDAHYLSKEDRGIHKAYLTSDEDDGGDREVDDFYSATHFFSSEELHEAMDYLGKEFVDEAILNTYKIYEQVQEYDLYNEQEIPKIQLPNREAWFEDTEISNLAKEYEWINKMNGSDNEYDNYLISLISKGIAKRIPKNEYEETLNRIDIECKEIMETSIKKCQPISSYFVTMEKNIEEIWKSNSIVAPGRGSAGGYIINYLLDITQVNPLKQGIEMPHWRFLTSQRPEYPRLYWGQKVNFAKRCVA